MELCMFRDAWECIGHQILNPFLENNFIVIPEQFGYPFLLFHGEDPLFEQMFEAMVVSAYLELTTN